MLFRSLTTKAASAAPTAPKARAKGANVVRPTAKPGVSEPKEAQTTATAKVSVSGANADQTTATAKVSVSAANADQTTATVKVSVSVVKAVQATVTAKASVSVAAVGNLRALRVSVPATKGARLAPVRVNANVRGVKLSAVAKAAVRGDSGRPFGS